MRYVVNLFTASENIYSSLQYLLDQYFDYNRYIKYISIYQTNFVHNLFLLHAIRFRRYKPFKTQNEMIYSVPA